MLPTTGSVGCAGQDYAAAPSSGCPSDPTSTYEAEQIDSSLFALTATIRIDAAVFVESVNQKVPEGQECVRLCDITTQ